MPKSSECFKVIPGSIHSEGLTSDLASSKKESMSPSTSIVGSIPNLNPCLQASLHDGLDKQDAAYSTHRDLLDIQSLREASDSSYQPTAVEWQTDPAVAELPVLVEAPIFATAVEHVPHIAEDLHPTSKELWKSIEECLDLLNDSRCSYWFYNCSIPGPFQIMEVSHLKPLVWPSCPSSRQGRHSAMAVSSLCIICLHSSSPRRWLNQNPTIQDSFHNSSRAI